MNKNELSLQSDNENSILPFLGMQIFDAKIPMDISIRRSKNIINRETFKLVDEFKMLNLKNSFKIKNELKSGQPKKENSEINRLKRIRINNSSISTSDDNLYLKQKFKKMKTTSNKSFKYKKIKNIKLSSVRDKYISLIKKFKNNDEKKQNNSLSESKINNSKILKLNKSNSNLKIDIPQINNPASILDTSKTSESKQFKKALNKTFSKINTLSKKLKDTQRKSLKIIKNIKRFKLISKKENENMTDIINRRDELLQKIEDLMDEENSKKNRITRINYNKILGPLNKAKDNSLKKIDLSKKLSRQIWLKKSTANMIKFGQYFNMMDDEQFFKERKKIIRKFADIEKESDIIDGIKTESIRPNFGQAIKKNNQIIKQLAENNFDFFQNVSKKFGVI
jgi:hypothetical protein